MRLTENSASGWTNPREPPTFLCLICSMHGRNRQKNSNPARSLRKNMISGVTTIQKTQNKKPTKKGLTKLISLNSVRPFCWFHTYYLITTRFRINNAKISRVIILLSNRTLSALKCPSYKGFQKIFITQTRLCHAKT